MTTTLTDIAAAGVVEVLRAPAPGAAMEAIAALVQGDHRRRGHHALDRILRPRLSGRRLDSP
jgi:hypothetical protein